MNFIDKKILKIVILQSLIQSLRSNVNYLDKKINSNELKTVQIVNLN